MAIGILSILISVWLVGHIGVIAERVTNLLGAAV